MIESTLPKLLIFIEQGYSKELVGISVYRTTLGHPLSFIATIVHDNFEKAYIPSKKLDCFVTIKIVVPRNDLALDFQACRHCEGD